MSIKSIKKQEGFTIIEVMIVLAIAAVIMLVVFLAVPQLQRNSRNTQRNADAARVNAAVVECLANHNNTISRCDGSGTSVLNYDTTKNSQLTGALTFVAAGAYSTTVANVVIGTGCNATGDGLGAASTGAVAITFANESSGANVQRCVGG